ncbi:MAG: hypothetical protein IPJ19_15260 [Planctomycetes bacterium]|nr:hypothetical protein [Planctomycetota bacterium]
MLWVLRIELSGGQAGKATKTFRPVHRNADGFQLGDPPGPLPLYRLPKLEAGTVYVTEGEKAADAAVAIGLNTTTSAHGAQSPQKTDWMPLAGRRVVVLIDNDSAGRAYGERVARILIAQDPKADIRIVLLPGLPPGGDIVEYVEAQRASGGDDAQIRSRVDWLGEHTEGFVGSVGTPPHTSEEDAEPLLLPDEKPSVAPFDIEFIPRRLQAWVWDIAERMQCPADFLFVAVVEVMAALIGRKAGHPTEAARRGSSS